MEGTPRCAARGRDSSGFDLALLLASLGLVGSRNSRGVLSLFRQKRRGTPKMVLGGKPSHPVQLSFFALFVVFNGWISEFHPLKV